MERAPQQRGPSAFAEIVPVGQLRLTATTNVV